MCMAYQAAQNDKVQQVAGDLVEGTGAYKLASSEKVQQEVGNTVQSTGLYKTLNSQRVQNFAGDTVEGLGVTKVAQEGYRGRNNLGIAQTSSGLKIGA